MSLLREAPGVRVLLEPVFSEHLASEGIVLFRGAIAVILRGHALLFSATADPLTPITLRAN
jgi:hypothetical protein